MKILTIDISGKCNLECSFCYQTIVGELSAGQVMDHVNSNPDFETVEIGGGEPFTHGSLIEILKQTADSGKSVNIATNATFIPEGLLRLESSVRDNIALQVSLPAGNARLYRHVTGSDFFDNVVENMARLKERYEVSLSSAIYADNFETVPEILGLACRFNIPARINLVFPVGRGKDVKLLNKGQVDRLKGLLLAESLQHPGIIESPLIRPNNCGALGQAYDIQKAKLCLADCGCKKYINPLGEASKCEFFGGKE